jgi:predicted pyridoxine 5'-phosphate oxidase superfamily flavin-nucleotide-binding protein
MVNNVQTGPRTIAGVAQAGAGQRPAFPWIKTDEVVAAAAVDTQVQAQASSPAAGWYDDSSNPGFDRWWDPDTGWTDRTRPCHPLAQYIPELPGGEPPVLQRQRGEQRPPFRAPTQVSPSTAFAPVPREQAGAEPELESELRILPPSGVWG